MTRLLARPTGTLLCAGAVLLGNLHCGSVEQVNAEEPSCGELAGPRQASPAVVNVRASVKGAIDRGPEGESVRLVLSPVVDVSGGLLVPVRDTIASVQVGGSAVDFDVATVSADNPVLVDVVFLVNSSAGMDWAIDGLRNGLEPLLAAASGVDVRLAGVEFADHVRSSSELGDLAAFNSWLFSISAAGGGDYASSVLDAILFANDSIGFRASSLRYLIVFGNTGVHERSDGTGCSDVNLKELEQRIESDTLVVLLSPTKGDPPGIAGRQVAATLGGLCIDFGLLSLLDVNLADMNFGVMPLFDGSSLASVGFTLPDDSDNAAAARLTFDTGDLRFSQDFQASD